MSYMFECCQGLESIIGIDTWDTANVTNMYGVFYQCNGLSTLDLSSWDTSNVTSMSAMFIYCSKLSAIYIGSSWSTASVTSGTSMFYGCTSLPNYNSSYVTHEDCSRYMTLKSN